MQTMINLLNQAYQNTKHGAVNLSAAHILNEFNDNFIEITVQNNNLVARKARRASYWCQDNTSVAHGGEEGEWLYLKISKKIVEQFGGTLKENSTIRGREYSFRFSYEDVPGRIEESKRPPSSRHLELSQIHLSQRKSSQISCQRLATPLEQSAASHYGIEEESK